MLSQSQKKKKSSLLLFFSSSLLLPQTNSSLFSQRTLASLLPSLSSFPPSLASRIVILASSYFSLSNLNLHLHLDKLTRSHLIINSVYFPKLGHFEQKKKKVHSHHSPSLGLPPPPTAIEYHSHQSTIHTKVNKHTSMLYSVLRKCWIRSLGDKSVRSVCGCDV